MSRSAAKRKVLLCGYYGEHNIGDDALLQVLLDQMPANWEPEVTAYDQEQIENVFGIATTGRRSLVEVLEALGHCDALVLGGGSLLQDSTSFQSLLYYAALILRAWLGGKPVLLWGQGLGPLSRRRSRALVWFLLRRVTLMSWRDSASYAWATAWGNSSLLGSDPVWALTPSIWQGEGGAIVLCWREVPKLESEGWRVLLRVLDQLVAEADRKVLWLPFHREQDSGLLKKLDDRGLLSPSLNNCSREVAVTTAQEAMAVFSSAGLVLAMRLHSLILAALSGSPCAALSYDPKVAAAARGVGCPCQDLADPLSTRLLDDWRATLDHPPDWERIEAQRNHALVHQQVFQLFEGRELGRDGSAKSYPQL